MCKIFEANSYLSGNTLYKFINGKWIGKPAVQIRPGGKGYKMVWIEEAKPEEIDTDYYNLDGTKK